MGSSQRQYNTLQNSEEIAAPPLSENCLNGYEDDIRRPLLGSSSSTDLEGNGKEGSQSWLRAVYEEGKEIWLQGKGMILVTLAQFFGASMNVMTQILELDSGLHPFQILFARMSVTVVASYLYMWYTKVPHPFGTRPVLGLLIFRAMGGFFGVYSIYYAVQYLPLSEATVLTFLAPILCCYACSLFIPNETFTRRQQLAAVVSMGGVVLIARPFSSSATPPDPGEPEAHKPGTTDEFQRIVAILAMMVGVLGSTCAYTSIRIIGQRCHPLVSVTYFSMFTTVMSFLAMLLVPSVPFKLPETGLEWALIVGLGVCGFLLQFLLTAGLSYVPPPPRRSRRVSGGDGSESKPARSSSGSRATSMIYTQMLFALFYDKVVWGNTLSPLSWAGSALIVGSALYVALVRDGKKNAAAAVPVDEAAEEGGGPVA
ncbi:uncharacterized membrane protein YMR253C [Aspergillus lentulus]|uniref:Uncharacterized membrane protein YMR253C n=1 Tax=Aspergillus lentulus TaxID=293939 RepID=A0ABQ1A3U9_ASPLE|nr:uncharacterized membrane protein YMR253C [Aspergillus lentulus]GFF41626.1 uncharacterized membrane protein YMR253C [Aspergillus lentulus]GFF53354.1 uncharacterized membrane protein YMR253C [Aspergillus lentulus]GFF72860.1 uncharacterized membrane protein YMR253C [Aspergillus lentulus]GFF77160.1 uncharacterized membrane protein YMR253C [Aspergillus lentulus]GFG07969.1 uncharacterized membrane protein YMR253C [Aspergillus lentulus]